MSLELRDGITATVVLPECLTNGALAVIEYRLSPQVATSSHSHSKEDEYVYVLAGELLVTVGGRSEVLQPGATIAKPRGVPHDTRNVGSVTARYLTFLLPGGFDRYVELASDLAGGPLGAPLEALDDLASRCGLTFCPVEADERGPKQ